MAVNPSRKVYCVTSAMSGYLPDFSAVCATKAMAKSVAIDTAREFREENYSVSGNANEGYVCTPNWTDHPIDGHIEIAEMKISDYIGLADLADMHISDIQDHLNSLSD